MKLKHRFLKRGRVEIIPMIDTILILLIFYMSFSTLGRTEKRLDVRMPPTRPGADIGVSTETFLVSLHVQGPNKILVNNSVACDLATLRELITPLGQFPDTRVVIDGNRDTSYQDIVRALDVCAQAHLTKVAFPTRDTDPAAGRGSI